MREGDIGGYLILTLSGILTFAFGSSKIIYYIISIAIEQLYPTQFHAKTSLILKFWKIFTRKLVIKNETRHKSTAGERSVIAIWFCVELYLSAEFLRGIILKACLTT